VIAFRGFTLRAEPRPADVTTLEQGQVFVNRQGKETEVGMIAATDDGLGAGERLVVILGSTRRDVGAVYPIAFRAAEYEGRTVYPVPSPRLELGRGKYGLAEAAESKARSRVLVDPSNLPWIRLAISGTSGPGFLDLRGGSIGLPREPYDCYGDWRMVWRPEGAEEDVILLDEGMIRPQP